MFLSRRRAHIRLIPISRERGFTVVQRKGAGGTGWKKSVVHRYSGFHCFMTIAHFLQPVGTVPLVSHSPPHRGVAWHGGMAWWHGRSANKATYTSMGSLQFGTLRTFVRTSQRIEWHEEHSAPCRTHPNITHSAHFCWR